MQKKKKPKTISNDLKGKPSFDSGKAPSEWLQEPLVCEAVRMQSEPDPWEKKGKIVRQNDATEQRRKKLAELSLNIEHFISDENGAAAA